MFIEIFLEKVSPDCSTGAGIVPSIGPYKGFKVVRTSHLDDPRNPPNPEERDDGFDCDTFDTLAKKFFQKRPLGVADGDYSIFWKSPKGTESAIVNVNNTSKKFTFVTIMQLHKRNMNDYRIKQKTIKIDLGNIPEPN